MTEANTEYMAYRLIRQEVRRFDRKTTDAELGNYIKGVVDMQSSVYNLLNEEMQMKKEENN